jgi:hypothetical protein
VKPPEQEETMKFVLIYSYDPAERSPTKGEVSDWLAFEEAAKQAGVHVFEAGLQSSKRARTISRRGGESATEDGPIVGSNGQVVAGFWVLDVEDSDAAVVWAQRLPPAATARSGSGRSSSSNRRPARAPPPIPP